MKIPIEKDGKEVANLDLVKLKNGDLEIEYLWTDPQYRNQGLATQLLLKAIAIADKMKKPLVAFIEPARDSGLTVEQERAWLAKHGFVPKRYDYGGFYKPVMYRNSIS